MITKRFSRTRKDNSSVEDNYEWDSEFAAESEILEALQHFEDLKTSTPISEVRLRMVILYIGEA